MTGQETEGSNASSQASAGFASSRGRGRGRGRVRARGVGMNRGGGLRGRVGVDSVDRSSIQSDGSVGVYTGVGSEKVRPKVSDL